MAKVEQLPRVEVYLVGFEDKLQFFERWMGVLGG